MGIGHWAWGMGHGALGMGHGAWGIGHWEEVKNLTFNILPLCSLLKSLLSPTPCLIKLQIGLLYFKIFCRDLGKIYG